MTRVSASWSPDAATTSARARCHRSRSGLVESGAGSSTALASSVMRSVVSFRATTIRSSSVCSAGSRRTAGMKFARMWGPPPSTWSAVHHALRWTTSRERRGAAVVYRTSRAIGAFETSRWLVNRSSTPRSIHAPPARSIVSVMSFAHSAPRPASTSAPHRHSTATGRSGSPSSRLSTSPSLVVTPSSGSVASHVAATRFARSNERNARAPRNVRTTSAATARATRRFIARPPPASHGPGRPLGAR